MANPLATTEQIARAISEGFKLVAQILSGAEIRKLRYRVEAAMAFVHVVEKSGEYKGITDEKQRQLEIHFIKRIFDE